ncbi:MAG: hypothetical protein DWQ10_15390 [Calditrichaeota bacterium]|nr:MAG: hypothetical protein DWQ10_15390 [Calditrichota bacterium]
MFRCPKPSGFELILPEGLLEMVFEINQWFLQSITVKANNLYDHLCMLEKSVRLDCEYKKKGQ